MFRKHLSVSILFLSIFTCLSPSRAQESDSLTVAQAIRLAVENHPAVQQAQQGVVASQARVDQSRSARYPDVKVEALYSRIGPVPEISMPLGASFQLASEDNYNFHLSLRETVYDFGRRSTGEELARSGQRSADDNVELIKSNLAYRTIETFYAILFLRRNLAVLDEQIEALNQHLLITQRKVQTGSATDFDVLTTHVRISAVKTRKIDVANLLQRQENTFRQLTGLAPDQPVALKGDFSVTPISLNADSLLEAALNQLPDVRLSKAAETSADVRFHLASLGMKPMLNANLDFGFKNGYPDNLNRLKANWIAGAQLQVPLFNGFLTRSQKQEAQANLNAAQAHTRDLERQIMTTVTQALADVRTSQEKVANTQPQAEQARQAVVLAEARYSAGVATNLDLLDAQTALADAELAQLKALYDLKISYYNLGKAVGHKVW